jgi:TatA/E family protein of Tat protein translocase
MGPLGTEEIVFILVLALLLFGPKKLPELGKTIGKAMTEFRRAQSELKTTFDREMRNLEQETGIKELVANNFQPITTITNLLGHDPDYYSGTYDSDYSGSYNSTSTTPRSKAHPQFRAPGPRQHCKSKRRPALLRAAIWKAMPNSMRSLQPNIVEAVLVEHGHSAPAETAPHNG